MELPVIYDKIKQNLLSQVEEKGYKQMLYSFTKAGKVMVGYSKNTLEQIRIDLGLIVDYDWDITPLANGNSIISVKCTLSTNDGMLINVGLSGAESFESPCYRGTKERMPDTLRLIPIAKKRALAETMTPILIRLGVDYEAIRRDLAIKESQEIVMTSNVEDLKKIQEEKDNLGEFIEKDKVEKLYNTAIKGGEVFKQLCGVLKVYKNIIITSVEELTKAEVMKITNKEYEILIDKVKEAKNG